MIKWDFFQGFKEGSFSIYKSVNGTCHIDKMKGEKPIYCLNRRRKRIRRNLTSTYDKSYQRKHV